ncbi:hypothetical protein [Bacillus suaedaesalsae]|nr:hypothetical protein [Bacillus suaedaesalsae]
MDLVMYKGFECKVVFNYGNGNLEILYGKDVLLVSESQIKFLVTN